MKQQTQQNSTKIGYVVGKFPSISETFIAREIDALQSSGFNVFVFSLAPPPPPQSPFMQNTNKTINTFYIKPSMKHLLKSFFQYPIADFYNRARALCLVELVKKFSINHLHAHFAFYTADTASITAKTCGITYSVSIHASDIFTRPPALLRQCLLPASFVAACSKAAVKKLAETVPELPQEKIFLIKHGVPSVFFQQQYSPDEKQILAVGRLVKKKGFCYLLRACFLLKGKGVSFKCAIIGDGPEKSSLAAEIKRLKLQSNVSLVGALSQKDLIEWYKKAEVLVVPSTVDEKGDMDGIPNVILEAMSMGIPVIASGIGGIPEAVLDGKTGVIIPPADPSAITEAIEKLFNDKALRYRLGGNGKSFVKTNFNAEKNIKPLAELFKKHTLIETSNE